MAPVRKSSFLMLWKGVRVVIDRPPGKPTVAIIENNLKGMVQGSGI